MNLVDNKDISEELKKAYKRFYVMHVARFSDHFYDQYFDYLNTHIGDSSITFIEVYEYINGIHKKRQPSFSSKLLHTINPDYPIYDSKVLKALNIKGNDPIEKYRAICNWYSSFNRTKEEELWVNEFDKAHPNAVNISKTKKIDFILWRKPSN